MNQHTKKEPTVKVVKRYSNFKRPVLYVLVSNIYNNDNSIIYKIFPSYDIAQSSKAERLN